MTSAPCVRVLGRSPLAELVDVSGLARDMAAPDGLAGLVTALDELGPVAQRALRAGLGRLRRVSGGEGAARRNGDASHR